MGLAERRAALEFETNALPALKARIDKTAGFAIPMDIRWDTISPVGESRLYAESWPAVYFEPLAIALESIARDAMGKEALQTGLKSVVIQNTRGVYYADTWATFEGGALTLDHEPLTNAGDLQARADGLIKVLEAGL